jgi:hypothetical protein
MEFSGDLLGTQRVVHTHSFGTYLLEQDLLWSIFERSPNILMSESFAQIIPTLHNLDLYSIPISVPSTHTLGLFYRTLEHQDLSNSILAYDAEQYTPFTWMGHLFLSDIPHDMIELVKWLDDQLSILNTE